VKWNGGQKKRVSGLGNGASGSQLRCHMTVTLLRITEILLFHREYNAHRTQPDAQKRHK
jgi:hypothetical protein